MESGSRGRGHALAGAGVHATCRLQALHDTCPVENRDGVGSGDVTKAGGGGTCLSEACLSDCTRHTLSHGLLASDPGPGPDPDVVDGTFLLQSL